MVSSNLMYSILAMDVYHQGGASLDHKETQIGTAILSQESDTSADSEAVAAGFYAASYDWNGITVISYRGTNQLSDIWNGWVTGAGVWDTDQVRLAAEFYQAVFAPTIPEIYDLTALTQNSVVFTGHSLGGGLAGIMASIYGRTATVFDSMPYKLAASNLHDWASLTDAETPVGSFIEEQRQYARDTFYLGDEVWAPRAKAYSDSYKSSNSKLKKLAKGFFDDTKGTVSAFDALMVGTAAVALIQIANDKGVTLEQLLADLELTVTPEMVQDLASGVFVGVAEYGTLALLTGFKVLCIDPFATFIGP